VEVVGLLAPVAVLLHLDRAVMAVLEVVLLEMM
jgi:hypothetical protein